MSFRSAASMGVLLVLGLLTSVSASRAQAPDPAATPPASRSVFGTLEAVDESLKLVGGPMVDGACGKASDAPLTSTTIPMGGQAEVADACWCCAPAGETCTPANRTGAGQAFLANCYK